MPSSLSAFASGKTVRLATIVIVAVALPIGGASAQGFFDFLFGNHAPRPPPEQYRTYTPPDRETLPHDRRLPRASERHSGERARTSSDRSRAPRVAYCVRLCDGRYFPIGGHDRVSAAETCNSFCPATATRLFYGRDIDQAKDRHGGDYTALENAYAYREEVVRHCSCNGRSSFGLARLSVGKDPTLRAGDIVASHSGLAVYNGKSQDRQAAYTPIDSAKLPDGVREQLPDVQVRGQRRLSARAQ